MYLFCIRTILLPYRQSYFKQMGEASSSIGQINRNALSSNSSAVWLCLSLSLFEIFKMASEKVYTPLLPPSTTYKDDPRAVLSTAEKTMYEEVLAHFTTESPVYTLPHVEKGDLQEREKFWLSRECILRYVTLDARNSSCIYHL